MTRHDAIMELSALVRSRMDANEERERCAFVLKSANEKIEKALLDDRNPEKRDRDTREEYERLHAKALRAVGAAEKELLARGHGLRETIRRTPADNIDAVFGRAVSAVRERLGKPQPRSPWPCTWQEKSETWEMVTKGDCRTGRFYCTVTLDGQGVYVFASCDHGIGSKRRETVHTFIAATQDCVKSALDGKFGFGAARTAEDCEPPAWRHHPMLATIETALSSVDALIAYGNENGPMKRLDKSDRW